MVDSNLSYDQEQERFRKEFEGESDPDAVRINFKEPDVRPEVYRDVESLLFRGFLIVTADINGVQFVFKSLNNHEFDMLRLIGGVVEGREPPSKFWTLFLAQCVFVIDGINVLTDRASVFPRLTELFESLPRNARQRIIRYVSEINRRASNAVLLTEAYAMERISRFKWAQFRELDLTSTSVTGIEGTQSLGLNWAQLLWKALNYYEDLEYNNEREWENAKFVGSCFAGKGLSKVYGQDQRRREKEKEDRAARKDQLLRHVLLGEPLDSKEAHKGNTLVRTAHTVEDLASQLEADLKGDKDFHDHVVEATENRIREQNRRRRKDLEDLLAKNFKESDGKPIMGGTDFTGLTSREVQERIVRRRQLEAQSVASRIVHPELEDPKMLRFLDKIGASGEIESQITKTDRDVTNIVPLHQAKGPGTPFRR